MSMLMTLYITLAEAAAPAATGATANPPPPVAPALPPPPAPLSASGWTTMLLAISVVTLWFGWSIIKVLTTPNADEKLHAPLEIDTRDADT